jgi:hypothetical protein
MFLDQKDRRTSVAVDEMTYNGAAAPWIRGQVKIKSRVSDVGIPMRQSWRACILPSPGGRLRHAILYGSWQRKAGTEGSNAGTTWILVQLLSRARKNCTASVERDVCILKRQVRGKDLRSNGGT